MKLIIKDRGSGKTTGLLYTSEATGYPIVVSTYQQVELLKERAKQLGILIPEPLAVKDMKARGYIAHKNILVDEALSILGDAMDCYLGCHVVAATMTDEH